MQPLPGLALVWVGKSREFSCSCVFKELQNALQHLSALWFPQVCEVCVCLPESYNYLWESNLWKHSRGKKNPGLVNPSMVSSSKEITSNRAVANCPKCQSQQRCWAVCFCSCLPRQSAAARAGSAEEKERLSLKSSHSAGRADLKLGGGVLWGGLWPGGKLG